MQPSIECDSLFYAVGMTIDDRYKLTEFIGSGGMACVYKAYEANLPHPYAIKFLKLDFHNQEYLVRYFELEADNMRDLAHPNIVRFYRFVHTDDYSYIVMDYVQGYALSDIIKTMYAEQRHVPLDEVLRIMVQVARALEAIHREGFVHRDVKPGNVLISTEEGSKGKTYLGDLGITAPKEQLMLGAGTLAYMSPEQYGRGLVDHRADVYAFGIMLFELLARQRPFRAEKGLFGRDAEESLARQHRETPVPNVTKYRDGLPNALNTVMSKGLAKKPEDRYDSVLEFTRAVHHTLKPQLSADMQDFDAITHIQLGAPVANPVPYTGGQALPATDPKRVASAPPLPPARSPWVGAAAVGGILLGVAISAVLFSNAGGIALLATETPTLTATLTLTATASATFTPTDTATATATPTSTNTPTATVTKTPTPTDTFTPTYTPTATRTPTKTHTPEPTATASQTFTPTHTATDTPTATLTPDPAESGVTWRSAADVLATGTLDLPARDAWVFLSAGVLENYVFSAQLDSDDNQASYQIAVRYIHARHYVAFIVQPAQWSLAEVRDGTTTIITQGDFTPQANGTLKLKLKENVLTAWLDEEQLLQRDLPADDAGSIALRTATGLTVTNPNLMLIGDDAERAATNPALFGLRSDVQALLNTRDAAELAIDCPAYMAIFERLADYTADEVTDLAQQTRRAGQGIFARCRADSPTGWLVFQSGVQDYTNWEAALATIAATLED